MQGSILHGPKDAREEQDAPRLLYRNELLHLHASVTSSSHRPTHRRTRLLRDSVASSETLFAYCIGSNVNLAAARTKIELVGG